MLQLLKLMCLEPISPTTRETTEMRRLHTITREWPPLTATREKAHVRQKTSSTAIKINAFKIIIKRQLKKSSKNIEQMLYKTKYISRQ